MMGVPVGRRTVLVLCLVAVLLLVVIPLLLVNSRSVLLAPVAMTLTTAQAVGELGLSAGLLCLSRTSVHYDPRHEAPPRAFLAELPETAVAAHLAGQVVTVEHVEVWPTGERAVVRARVSARDGGAQARILTLRASRYARVSMDLLPDREVMLCNKHIGGWQVVAEQDAS